MAGTSREVVPEYGPSGEGQVKVLSDKIKVKLAGEVFEFPKDADYLPRGPMFEGAGLYIAISKDETKFQYVRPFKGTFIARYAGMVHDEDELPQSVVVPARPRSWTDPKTGKTKKWVDPERLRFTVRVEVTDGKYAGAVYPIKLDDLFARDTDGNMKVRSSRRKWLESLEKAWECFGYNWDNEAVQYEPNLLPVFDEMFSEWDARFNINVENGWIGSMAPLAEGIVVKKTPRKVEPIKVEKEVAVDAGAFEGTADSIEDDGF